MGSWYSIAKGHNSKLYKGKFDPSCGCSLNTKQRKAEQQNRSPCKLHQYTSYNLNSSADKTLVFEPDSLFCVEVSQYIERSDRVLGGCTNLFVAYVS